MADDGTRDAPAHDTGTGRGEEGSALGKEAGRQEEGASGAGRPAGKSRMRDSTGINAEDREPQHPDSPTLPPA